MIVADPRNPLAQRYEAALREHLPEGVDGVAIVIGGDGFMLATINQLGHDRVYLGLNAGRVGFLLNDVTATDEGWSAIADRLRARAWKTSHFPLLTAQITRADGTVTTEHAVNDVVLERHTGQTAHLGLSIDGTPVVEHLVCDGVIFATALGSTAYTFSAGGPACHPTLRTMAVTAICPHKPRLSPFLLPEASTARLDVLAADRRPVRAVTDGRMIEDVRAVAVALGPDSVKIAFLQGHDFTTCMVSKILRA